MRIILFIAGGAFEGLSNIVKKRISGGGIGFDRNLKSEIDDEMKGIIGLIVRHRQPGTLIREAERRKDLLTHNVLIGPEGELRANDTKVDIQMELVSHRGNSTISIQRIANLVDSSVATRFMVEDWKKLVRLSEERSDFLNL